MTKNRLMSLSLSDLIAVAEQQGIINCEEMERDDLIDSIIDAFEESRLERLEDDNWTIQSMCRKFDIFQDEEISLEKKADIPDHFNNLILVMRRIYIQISFLQVHTVFHLNQLLFPSVRFEWILRNVEF